MLFDDALANVSVVAPVKVPLIVGVVIVGDVPKTSEPDPVSSVTAASRFALVGVDRNVATFAAGVVVANVVNPNAVRCAAAADAP